MVLAPSINISSYYYQLFWLFYRFLLEKYYFPKLLLGNFFSLLLISHFSYLLSGSRIHYISLYIGHLADFDPWKIGQSGVDRQSIVLFFLIFCNILLVCGRRYKNGPGLKYHYTHYNHEQETGATMHHEEPVISHPSTPAPTVHPESPKVPASPPQQRGPGRPKKVPGSGTSPNNYCDFCLGDVYENKSTGYPEELLSCADCGRSGTH